MVTIISFSDKCHEENEIMSERNWVVGVKRPVYFRPDGLGKLLWGGEINSGWNPGWQHSQVCQDLGMEFPGQSQKALSRRKPGRLKEQKSGGRGEYGGSRWRLWGRWGYILSDVNRSHRTVFNKGVTWSDLHLKNISGCSVEKKFWRK